MSAEEENKLLKMVIETQASRISEQEELIKELRATVADLRSLKANLEETLREFQRQIFGTKSEKTGSAKQKVSDSEKEEKKPVSVKAHTRERKAKATRDELYGNLPVREIICNVPESERYCDYCNVSAQ